MAEGLGSWVWLHASLHPALSAALGGSRDEKAAAFKTLAKFRQLWSVMGLT